MIQDLSPVLIETLWNVKVLCVSCKQRIWRVLIETLWNVKNYTATELTKGTYRINRNIVECKVLHCGQKNWFCHIRINRNIVECKALWTTFLTFSCFLVLIETLWNVKRGQVIATPVENIGINRNIVECKDHQSIVEAFGAALY